MNSNSETHIYFVMSKSENAFDSWDITTLSRAVNDVVMVDLKYILVYWMSSVWFLLVSLHYFKHDAQMFNMITTSRIIFVLFLSSLLVESGVTAARSKLQMFIVTGLSVAVRDTQACVLLLDSLCHQQA